MNALPLSMQERVVFSLRALYERYGYSRYTMSKFEEYDLYAKNKDFLISDGVITFTDTNGKLMALKPDVTLSIVKNTRDTRPVRKLYYNENVYRVAKGSHSFREIMQVGLECLGDVDDYCISEVLLLAAQSLQSISPRSVLSISHLGLLSEVLDALGVPADRKGALLHCIGEKNLHEAKKLCLESGMDSAAAETVGQLIAIDSTPAAALQQLRQLLAELVDPDPLEQLTRIVSALESQDLQDMLRIDFSMVDDIHYYNGIVFKGFINGIPGSVLSGGQYDKLMTKMGRKDRAIGFAIYTDMLERLQEQEKSYDVDTVLLCAADAEPAQVLKQVTRLTAQGSVLVQQQIPESICWRRLMKLNGSEVELLENNA